MSECKHCGGLIAEPNKAYGFAGKWCHCGWANDQFTVPHRTSPNIDEVTKRKIVEGLLKEKGNVQKPSMSHIINLCEQLSMGELGALIGVLQQLHDNAVLASKPPSSVPNAPSPYEVKGL